MNITLARQLLSLPELADKAAIKAAYRQYITSAEDRIDDARTAVEEDAAWDYFKQLQQARSVLLKAQARGETEHNLSPTPAPAAYPHTPPTPTHTSSAPARGPIDVPVALALLGLEGGASLEQIQQAYQQQLERVDAAIDATSNPTQAEPLWEQHKQIQQARYLLLHSQSAGSSEPEPYATTKKQRHAFAMLGLQPDVDNPTLRKHYNQQIDELEASIAAAQTQQEENTLHDSLRELQRAFATANSYLQSAGSVTEPVTVVEPIAPSPHRARPSQSHASVDDFLKQQQRSQKAKRWLWVLLLVVLVAAGWQGAQQGYWQQLKDILIPPPSAEELAAQAVVIDLQQEAESLLTELQQAYEQARAQALQAAQADSADYPKRVRLRNSIDQRILQSNAYAIAVKKLAQAQQSIERAQYLSAETPLLDAKERLLGLQGVLAELLWQSNRTKPVKRRIPKPVVAKPPKASVAQAPHHLPHLNPQQQALMPQWVNIPQGRFQMGSVADLKFDETVEQPQHAVNVGAFKLAQQELSVQHFRQFVSDTAYQTEAERNINGQGCSVFMEETKSWIWQAEANWQQPGFKQSEQDPVVCVAWSDVQAYLNWLRSKTGWNVRLPTEAEWEYAVRAGTQSQWYWGNELLMERANCEECNQDWEIRRTFPSNKYPANAYGLYGMAGNVWEWTADCWQADYNNAPTDGRAQLAGDCSRRVTRGGSWYSPVRDLRSAARNASTNLHYRSSTLGFRIAVSD